MTDYIKWIRRRVGHDCIFLNFAAACITNDRGQVLLQKRGDKTTWGLPGGALELGESAEEAVIREVMEETGLVVATEYLVGIYTKYFDDYPNGDEAQVIVAVFACTITGGQLTVDLDETLELRFFEPGAFPNLLNQQHHDALSDFVDGQRGVAR